MYMSGGRGKGKESLADSPGGGPDKGLNWGAQPRGSTWVLNPTTLRPRPEPNSRVRDLT